MVRGLAEQQRFAGPYGHAQNDQRRSLPLGLLENGVSPVGRRSADNAHVEIAAVGDIGDLPERRLLVPARERASPFRAGSVRNEEDGEPGPRRAREFDCDFRGVTGIRCAGHEREDLQGGRRRIAFMHAPGDRHRQRTRERTCGCGDFRVEAAFGHMRRIKPDHQKIISFRRFLGESVLECAALLTRLDRHIRRFGCFLGAGGARTIGSELDVGGHGPLLGLRAGG